MADIKAVMDAIADRLRTVVPQVYTEPPGTVDAPAAIVELAGIDYDSTMSRGSDDLVFVVQLFVTAGPQGVQNLFAYLDGAGPSSIKAAFEEDPTLDGAVYDAAVTRAGKPDRAEMGQAEHYHVDIAIEAKVAG